MPNRILCKVGEAFHAPAVPADSAEDGVHNPCPPPATDLPGLVHRLVHRGVRRDRAHVQQLIGAQSEEVKKLGGERFDPPVQVEPQEVVEPPPEPDRAEDEFMDPPSLPGFETGSRRLPCQVESCAALDLPEKAEGSVPWTALRSGQPSIPREGELGTATSRAGIRPAL